MAGLGMSRRRRRSTADAAVLGMREMANHEVDMRRRDDCNTVVSCVQRQKVMKGCVPRDESARMNSWKHAARKVAGMFVSAAIAAYVPPLAGLP